MKNPELLMEPKTPAQIALFITAGTVLVLVWVLLWYMFCSGLQRGLAVSSLLEASMCLPCMWADTFTALKLRGHCRAWTYVALFVLLPIAWNITCSLMDPIYSPMQIWYQVERCVLETPLRASQGGDAHREVVDLCVATLQQDATYEKSVLVHGCFAGAMLFVYLAFSFDHCSTRRTLREETDGKTCMTDCGDCVAVFAVPQLALLQEAQHAADLGLLKKAEDVPARDWVSAQEQILT